jgi:hypothetical protein
VVVHVAGAVRQPYASEPPVLAAIETLDIVLAGRVLLRPALLPDAGEALVTAIAPPVDLEVVALHLLPPDEGGPEVDQVKVEARVALEAVPLRRLGGRTGGGGTAVIRRRDALEAVAFSGARSGNHHAVSAAVGTITIATQFPSRPHYVYFRI